MLKASSKCRVCAAIKESPDLAKEIFATSYYLPGSSRTLKDLYQTHHEEFSYDSLKNHVKRHQFMAKGEFNKRSITQIKKTKRQLVNIEKVKARDARDVWDKVIDKGMEDIESGAVVIKPEALLKAVKDKSDYEIKVKDQQLAYAEMMWHFASGESNESKSYDRRIIEGQEADYYDPTQSIAGNSGAGTQGPDNLHNSITWDAITSGSTTVPDGNSSQQD
jgi:hypothetical protein